MTSKQFLRNSLKKDNLLLLGLVVCITFAVVPILSFITVFAHERGHGLLIVPAIILNRDRNYESKRDLAFLTAFIIFCILNFGAILNNFFGADFAFIIEDILKFPSNEEWFRNILKVMTYLVFPIFLATKKVFEIDKLLTISVSTDLATQSVGEFLFIPLVPYLMANFWLLFILGLPILISTVGILIMIQKKKDQ